MRLFHLPFNGLPFREWNGYTVCTLHRIWHRHDHHLHLVYAVCQFALISVDLFCAISTYLSATIFVHRVNSAKSYLLCSHGT